MKITKRQYAKIAAIFPVQRGNVTYSNLNVLNAMLYVLENDGVWRKLPRRYGKWNSIYKRVNRWSKGGVLGELFEFLYAEGITESTVDVLGLNNNTDSEHRGDLSTAPKAFQYRTEHHCSAPLMHALALHTFGQK